MRTSTLVAAALVLIERAPVAHAFDVTTSSSGAAVHWQPGTVTFVPSYEPAPAGSDPVAVRAAFAASIATWNEVTEPYGISLALADPQTPRPRADDGVNTIRWVVTDADSDLERGTLARTYARFRGDDGELRDTDVVLNAIDFHWRTDMAGCANEYDLQSALTHELGHALGLAHSIGHPEATMFVTGDACEIGKRDLAPDDRDAIASLYAPTPGDGGGCSTADPGSLTLAFAALGLRRRRRPR